MRTRRSSVRSVAGGLARGWAWLGTTSISGLAWMDQENECRERAAYFRGLAQKATTERERQALLEAAAGWERAAEESAKPNQAA